MRIAVWSHVNIFVTRELHLRQQGNVPGSMSGRTGGSCVILSSLGAEAKVYYGHTCEQSETLKRGQTMVLPAALAITASKAAAYCCSHMCQTRR